MISYAISFLNILFNKEIEISNHNRPIRKLQALNIYIRFLPLCENTTTFRWLVSVKHASY